MSATIRRIPFFRHDLGEPELAALREVLAGPVLTTGEYVNQFEREFSVWMGRQHTVAVTSCTAALHLALQALGIGPGDEVITTPMTFIATSTAVLHAGAEPVWVDVEADTGNIDAQLIEAAITPRTRAILPVHLYGQMADMRAIRAIADRHGLHVIEDCAHCIEGERDGIRPGQLSDAACFSFYATKNMTCGEGGALVTDHAELAARVKLLRLHGMTKTAADRQREGYQHWDMTELGWKYNMDNLQAAMLLPQLARLQTNLQRRQVLAETYVNALGEIPGVRLPASRAGTHCRHLFPIWVSERDRVVSELQQLGIDVVVNYRAIHLLAWFANHKGHKRGDFPVAEAIGDATLSLPFFPAMPLADVDVVASAVRAVVR